MTNTRISPPAVAGTFYPANADALSRHIDAMLAQASSAVVIHPKALIAPHAGYVYSGPVAASAYALLQDMEHIRRVVLLGPAHRVPVSGLALPEVDSFSTPLGDIPLDKEVMESVAQLPQVVWNKAAHAMEHSLEVHLPFLQRVLSGEFQLVPLVVGDASPDDVAGVLDTLWGNHETLIVISSDLSHYLPYKQAQQVDQVTADNILAKQPISHEQACGATPINGLLAASDSHNLTPHLLDLRNSGDTAGDKQQVVGYGAFAFTETV